MSKKNPSGRTQMKKLRRRMRKIVRTQKRLAKKLARPLMPMIGGGALLAALAWLGQRMGLAPKIHDALLELKATLFPDERSADTSDGNGARAHARG